MMINQLSKVGIGTTSQLIVRIGAPYQQWLDHSHFCHLRLAPRSLHQCANSTCWTENNHNVVQLPNTQSVYYYCRLIIPLQYQILGAGDVVINWFLVLQCMAIATGQPCQEKKMSLLQFSQKSWFQVWFCPKNSCCFDNIMGPRSDNQIYWLYFEPREPTVQDGVEMLGAVGE